MTMSHSTRERWRDRRFGAGGGAVSSTSRVGGGRDTRLTVLGALNVASVGLVVMRFRHDLFVASHAIVTHFAQLSVGYLPDVPIGVAETCRANAPRSVHRPVEKRDAALL